MNTRKIAYFYILLAVLFWSTVATAFKIALRYLSVIQFLLFSSLTSTVILFFISLTRNNKITEVSFTRSLFYGLLNPFAYYIVLFGAYSLLPAQIAQPINYTWPIVLTVLSGIFLHQKVTIKSYIGIGLGLLGVCIISFSGKTAFPKAVSATGIVLAFLSAFIWSVFWILNLKDKREESVKLFFNFLFGTVYIFVLFLITGSFKHINIKGIPAAIYTGIFEMGVTYLLFIKAVKFSDSSAKMSNFTYLSPFLSLFFIGSVLGEKILFSTIAGLVFIVTGIITGNFERIESA